MVSDIRRPVEEPHPDRMATVFEMLTARLTDIEEQVNGLVRKQRHQDELAPAGKPISGELLCGRPARIVKHYDGTLAPGDVVYIEYDTEWATQDESPWMDTSVFPCGLHAKLIGDLRAVLGDLQYSELLRRAQEWTDGNPSVQPVSIPSADVGLAQAMHDQLEWELFHLAFLNRHRGMLSMGEFSVLLSVQGPQDATLASLLSRVDSVCKDWDQLPPSLVELYKIPPEAVPFAAAFVSSSESAIKREVANLPRWKRSMWFSSKDTHCFMRGALHALPGEYLNPTDF